MRRGAEADARFRAGCGRTQLGPTDLNELAYRALAFPECPGCPHRLEPADAPPFCRWLRDDRPHPFAPLAALRDEAPEEGAA